MRGRPRSLQKTRPDDEDAPPIAQATLDKWALMLNEDEVDDEAFIAAFTIRAQENDEDGRVMATPFVLRPAQKRLHDLETKIEETSYAEIHVPKSRKEGVSSHSLARYGFARILRRAGFVVTVTAHKISATGVHRRLLRALCAQVDWDALAALGYEIVEDTAHAFALKHKNGLVSRVEFLTARSEGLGRGETPNVVLSTERPHYPKLAKQEFFSILSGIPKIRGNGWIDESTANGEGDEFHADCLRAREGKGVAKLLFIACFEHPLNYARFESDAHKESFKASIGDPAYGDDGEELRAKALCFDHQVASCGLNEEEAEAKSWEFLHWRRIEIDTGCRGSVENFHQERPTHLSEAFLGTGRPVFDHRILRTWDDLADAKQRAGSLGRLDDREDGIVFTELPLSPIRVYKRPAAQATYCFGMDVAGGRQFVSGSGKSADWTVITIGDVYTGEIVAKFRDHVTTPEAARQLVLLARWYRCVELEEIARGYVELAGGYGDAVVAAVLEIEEGEYADCLLASVQGQSMKVKGQDETIYGFKSSKQGKAVLKLRGEEFVNQELGAWDPKKPLRPCPFDRDTLDEMKLYSYDEHGAMAASSGHDDCVIAFLLMLQSRANLFASGGVPTQTKAKKKAEETDPLTLALLKQREDAAKPRRQASPLGSAF